MLTLPSRAKINLFLEVVNKRRDGYHNLDSVFCEVELADTLSAETAPEGNILLRCSDPSVPLGDDNLIVRAARLLADACGVRSGIRFILDKRIPMGGGLGGGSSNAAAALRLANRLWKTGLGDRELAELGARLGSDVPFFLYGGTCLCTGRGELITPLEPLPGDTAFGLVLPDVHSDTASAYGGLRLPVAGEARSASRFIEAMGGGDIAGMAAAAYNRFEETVFRAIPELGALHRRLSAVTPYPPRLSGSGAGMWFFAAAEDVARVAGEMPEMRVLLTRPVSAHRP